MHTYYPRSLIVSTNATPCANTPQGRRPGLNHVSLLACPPLVRFDHNVSLDGFINNLVPSGFLQREAETLAPKAVIKSLRRSPSPQEVSDTPQSPRPDSVGSSSSEGEDEQIPPRLRTASISSVLSSLSSAMSTSPHTANAKMSKTLKVEVCPCVIREMRFVIT